MRLYKEMQGIMKKIQTLFEQVFDTYIVSVWMI